MPVDDGGGKYGDIGDPWGNPIDIPEGPYGPPGGGGPSGPGPSQNPFLPTFSGGSALDFLGPFGGAGIGGNVIRRRTQSRPSAGAFTGGGGGPFATNNQIAQRGPMMQSMGGGGGAGMGMTMGGGGIPGGLGGIIERLRGRMGLPGTQPGGSPITPGGGQQAPFDPRTEQFGSINDIINNLISHAVRGDIPGYGGAFGLNPPREIMDSMRRQAIGDAGAQERAARLGLQSRGDADPSTYGFQSLMSQLQGQQNTADTMGRAGLGLRQQQLQNLWGLLGQGLSAHQSGLNTEVGGRWQDAAAGGGGLGQFIPGIGGMVGGATRPWWLGGK